MIIMIILYQRTEYVIILLIALLMSTITEYAQENNLFEDLPPAKQQQLLDYCKRTGVQREIITRMLRYVGKEGVEKPETWTWMWQELEKYARMYDPFDGMSPLERRVGSTVSSHNPDRESPPEKQLEEYCRTTGIPREKIEAILIKFLEQGLQNPENRIWQRLAEGSAGTLGHWRVKSAVDLVEKAAFTPSDYGLRGIAIDAVIRIGSEGMLDFARKVVGDERFSYMERRSIYEELSPYVGVSAQKAVPIDFCKGDEEMRQKVLEFLLESQSKDTWNIYVIDEILCVASEQYKTSHEREQALKKLEDALKTLDKSKGEIVREYAARELKYLRELPPEQRIYMRMRSSDSSKTPEKEARPSQVESVSPISQPPEESMKQHLEQGSPLPESATSKSKLNNLVIGLSLIGILIAGGFGFWIARKK